MSYGCSVTTYGPLPLTYGGLLTSKTGLRIAACVVVANPRARPMWCASSCARARPVTFGLTLILEPVKVHIVSPQNECVFHVNGNPGSAMNVSALAFESQNVSAASNLMLLISF